MMKNSLIALLLFALMTGCKENAGIGQFDKNDAYIYFGYPNININAKERFVDSIFYSFAFDQVLHRKNKIIQIPVNIGGEAAGIDRDYSIAIANDSDYDPTLVQISKPIIRKGKFIDTLAITIERGAVLANEQMSLIVEILPNSHFKLGNYFNRKMKIVFDDIMEEPGWWGTWQAYFGDFHKEILLQWIQIYYLGADPTPDIYNSAPPPFYYWNRMPDTTDPSQVPVTIMYAERLKNYFNEHVVYPNGDPTKDRILLP